MKIGTIGLGILLSSKIISCYSQIEDFESYSDGAYITKVSNLWVTKSGGSGTAEDVTITDSLPARNGLGLHVNSKQQYIVVPAISTEKVVNFKFDAYFEQGKSGLIKFNELNGLSMLFSNSMLKFSLGGLSSVSSLPSNAWVEFDIDLNPNQGSVVIRWVAKSGNSTSSGLSNLTGSLDKLESIALIGDGNVSSPTGFYIDNVEIKGASTSSAGEFFLDEGFDMNIFPNPASEILHIDLTRAESLVKIELVDAQGRLISSNKSELEKDSFHLPISGLESGIYWVRVSTVRRTIVKQFVVK